MRQRWRKKHVKVQTYHNQNKTSAIWAENKTKTINSLSDFISSFIKEVENNNETKKFNQHISSLKHVRFRYQNLV